MKKQQAFSADGRDLCSLLMTCLIGEAVSKCKPWTAKAMMKVPDLE